MKKECPTIVRDYYKVMCRQKFGIDDYIDVEWDGEEYEDHDEARAVARKAEEYCDIMDVWIDSFCVDEEGNLWDYDEEWRRINEN